MRTVVLYIAMSLDGYIADSNGGVNWLGGDGSEPNNPGSFPTFINTVDTVILGYKTYHQIVTELSPGNWFYKGKTSYVHTHRQKESTDEIVFTGEHPADLVNRLKKQQGENIWICGGASIVNPLIEQDLVDRYHITVIPTILGDGVPLFEKHKTTHLLRLVSAQPNNGMIDLVYEKRMQRFR